MSSNLNRICKIRVLEGGQSIDFLNLVRLDIREPATEPYILGAIFAIFEHPIQDLELIHLEYTESTGFISCATVGCC